MKVLKIICIIVAIKLAAPMVLTIVILGNTFFESNLSIGEMVDNNFNISKEFRGEISDQCTKLAKLAAETVKGLINKALGRDKIIIKKWIYNYNYISTLEGICYYISIKHSFI